VRADQGYEGKGFAAEIKKRFGWKMEIVQKAPGKKGWQLLPKRWVVERTFAWFYRARTLWRNAEFKREHSEANLFIGMIRLMTRRLAEQTSKWHNQRILKLT
jgi:putative transposase